MVGAKMKKIPQVSKTSKSDPFDFFEDIRIINLAENAERLSDVTAEMDKMGVNFKRFDAVKRDQGAVGATLSHKQCIIEAKTAGKKNILIFEDDTAFMYDKEKTRKQLSVALDHLKDKDWDVLYFGINCVDVGDNPNNVIYPLCSGLYKVRAGYGAFAYVINGTAFDYFLSLFPEKECDINVKNHTIIDQLLRFNFAERHKLYLTPLVLMQKDNVSNIQGCAVNYNASILNRYKKYGVKY